jgi:hypothetical protein
MEIHIPFVSTEKLILHDVKGVDNLPRYILYLQPHHPVKGQQNVTHNVGALWLTKTAGGADCAVGHIFSPLFANGKLPIVAYATKDKDADYIWDVCLQQDKAGNNDND